MDGGREVAYNGATETSLDPSWVAACRRDIPATTRDLDCQGSGTGPDSDDEAGTVPELNTIVRT